MLVKELPEICRELTRAGYKVGLTTNGTIDRPDIYPLINRFGVSLDGEKEYHDNYRGPGVFDKAWALLNKVNTICETVVMSTLYSDNQEPLNLLRPLVEQLNPSYWQITKDVRVA